MKLIVATQATNRQDEFLQILPTSKYKPKSLILCEWQASTFRYIATLFHVLAEIIFYLISLLLLSVTRIKMEGSGNKMLLQEVNKKRKTQKKKLFFILFSTKIANSSRSDLDMFVLQYLCIILWLNFILNFIVFVQNFMEGFLALVFQ